jgi:CheY-like chemotaxis protein
VLSLRKRRELPTRFAALFSTARPDDLARAEEFAAAARAACGAALLSWDLGWSAAYGLAGLVLHLDAASGPALRQPLRSLASRCGGSVASGAATADSVQSLLAICEVRQAAAAPSALPGAMHGVLRASGLHSAPFAGALWFDLDLAGREADGLRYDEAAGTLFLAASPSLHVGDVLALRVLPPEGAPSVAVGTVRAVRRAGDAGPGSPAGLLLGLSRLPAEARMALAARCDESGRARRGSPRFRVELPARLAAAAGPGREDPDASIRSLSQGGAFVCSRLAWHAGERVRLRTTLPAGAQLRADATVVFRNERGIGVRLELDAAGELRLADALERIHRRPRNAVVVDDDALARSMIRDALQDRGFAVRAVPEGRSGMAVLAEHVLDTHLLVTDVHMPFLDGEGFVRMIRTGGGEQDLAIVVVTGSWSRDGERRLRAAGADAVLDKALGPEVLARAADAIAARKLPCRPVPPVEDHSPIAARG